MPVRSWYLDCWIGGPQMINDKTILVTGGAGAIGSVLVKQLSSNNSIVVLDNMSSGHEDNLPRLSSVKLFRASILDDEILREIFADYSFDYVFHLAANFANQNSVQYPQRDLEVNGMGILKLLQNSRDFNVGCFVYASSSCVYGNSSRIANENTMEFDVETPYAITKLLGERYTAFFHQYYGLNTVIVRIFNSYGPGEYPGKFRNVITNFFSACLAGAPVIITGSGNETRDFTFNADTVQGLLLAAENENACGQIINIGSGRETRIVDIARRIINLTGSKSELVFGERRSWDKIIHRRANIEKANRILGYVPRFGINEGLARTWDWVQEVKNSPLWSVIDR